MEKIGDVSLYKGEFTSKAKQNRNKIFKTVNAVNKTSNAKISVAILNPNKYFSANVVDGTLYIGADSLESDQWAKDLVHELTHLEEGTEDYAKLYNFLKSDDFLVDDGNGGKISLYQKASQSIANKGYGLDIDQLNEIIVKNNNNEQLTVEEKKILDTFESELTAHESDIILGNEAFIEKIIEQDTSLAKKLFDRIFHTKKALQKTDASKAEIKRLQEAEKLWLKSAKQIGNIQFIKHLQGLDDELEKELQQEVENKAETSYNRKGFQRERDYIHISQAERNALYKILSRLYSGFDGVVADDIVIESGNYVYIVDSGKENGKIDFGVVKRRTISNPQLRAEFIRSRNNEAISNGNVSDELSSKIRSILIGDFGSDMRRESRTELPTDSSKSTDNQSRTLGENTNRGNLNNTKFNLKDSLGIELSAEQQEFFKDSKVRDENGNLLVVYHGTEASFNIYKSSNGYEEYFFTDSYNASLDYGSRTKKQFLNLANPYIVDLKGKYDKEIFDAIDYAKENGFDGVIALNTFDGANAHNQYVAFSKNQIKNIDNKKPTSNPDIRFNRKAYTEKEYNTELKQLIESRGDYIIDSQEKLVNVVNFAFEKDRGRGGVLTFELFYDILEKNKIRS